MSGSPLRQDLEPDRPCLGGCGQLLMAAAWDAAHGHCPACWNRVRSAENQPSPAEAPPRCNCIPDQSRLEYVCQNLATCLIVLDRSAAIYSCDEHLALMLSDGENRVWSLPEPVKEVQK